MIEQFENGVLPAEKDWIKHVEDLRKNIAPSSKEEVKRALVKAVEKRVPKELFGLFLSGGVDSSLLAVMLKNSGADFICYCVGTKNSADVKAAKELANTLDLALRVKEYTLEEVEQLLKRTKKMLGKTDVPTLGVASVVSAAAELAEKDNIKVFFGGLGSEEIFAGYHRHSKVEDVNEECWRGLTGMWQRDLVRDHTIATKLGISVKVPFLDDELIKKAMGIPGERKISGEHKKIILREIAEELGLPHKFAWRQKKAAQYGSGFDAVMDKLCKKKHISKSEYVKQL